MNLVARQDYFTNDGNQNMLGNYYENFEIQTGFGLDGLHSGYNCPGKYIT